MSRDSSTWSTSLPQAKTGSEPQPIETFRSASNSKQDTEGLANNDYTVGWLCGISTEYVAAQAFLDEKHDGPDYVSANDNNDYTLGRIGQHNVVIAVLPDGEYGTASAARVARDMMHSFPNVRIGLIVGIGGGAPSVKHDIRLGDIVVSAPRKGMSGVCQFNLSTTIREQRLTPTGHLNQPPTALRTAVVGLRARYESDGHQIQKRVDEILARKPRLQKRYGRPNQDSDRLFESIVTHARNCEASRAEVCCNHSSAPICRTKRDDFEDDPAVHYGLIASADQLMIDAVLRDKLAEEEEVLCFETEAAGLMNHYPCIVIRGICDYSDTHKNQIWQGYAAMTAAAYAADLVERVSPTRVETEKKISHILSSGEFLDHSLKPHVDVDSRD
jgi:nucleoside phosphorylase